VYIYLFSGWMGCRRARTRGGFI